MGGKASHGSAGKAACRSIRCHLCMHMPAMHPMDGFGGVLVNVCHFCYNALQATHLEGQDDGRTDGGEF